MSDLLQGTGLTSPSSPLLLTGPARLSTTAGTARRDAATGTRAPAAAGGRTLWGYLLLPRPKDLVKAVVVPLTFLLGALAEGVDGIQVVRALVVWVALELLVYQARYQWNDIRGFAADQSHPDSASRGRLPGPPERARAHVGASAVVLAARLAAVVALVVLLPELRLGPLLLAVTAGVFGVAVVYERLRSAGTGRTGAVPAPLTPTLVAVWVAVGAGYAVRGLTGLALAVDLPARPLTAAAAAVALWATGTAFVTCRWTLEAMPFATVAGGRVRWHARREQAREHTTALVRWVPTHVDPRTVAAGTDAPAAADPARWRALHGRTHVTAPWNLATVLAAAAAAGCGHLLVMPAETTGTAAVALAGALAGLVVVAVSRRRFVAAVALFAVVVAALSAAGSARPVVVALPLLAVLLAHASFTSQCLHELGRPFSRVGPLLARCLPRAGSPPAAR